MRIYVAWVMLRAFGDMRGNQCVVKAHTYQRDFLVTQMATNLPAMQDTWVGSLSQEDPLEEVIATHSSILAWRITWTEEPHGLQFMGSQRFRHDWMTNTETHQTDTAEQKKGSGAGTELQLQQAWNKHSATFQKTIYSWYKAIGSRSLNQKLKTS